jgi:hypothetical protein
MHLVYTSAGLNKYNGITSPNLSGKDVAGSGRGLTSLYAAALKVQALWVATPCRLVNTGALF